MKKIVWLTNAPTNVGKRQLGLKEFGSGSWLENLSFHLSRNHNFEIHIISPYPGAELSFEEESIHYHIIDGGIGIFNMKEKKLLNRILEIIKTISPDLIHIHGTEKIFGLLQRKNPQIQVPIIISLQGLTGPYFNCYFSNLSTLFMPIIKSTDSFKRKVLAGILQVFGIIGFFLSGRREKQIMRANKNFFGRTFWDMAYLKKINPNAMYFHEPRILRTCFYSEAWDLKKADRFSVVLLNIRGPNKNAVTALKAISSLKQKYPQIQLRIGGIDDKHYYGQYLLYLAKKLGVSKNIQLLGYLKDNETVTWLKKSHLFCLTSLIENSPNTLAEAQIIGMPCIAHLTGGVPSYIEDHCSLTYDNNDIKTLVSNIDRIFSDDKFATELGSKAHKVARKRHDINHAVSCVEVAYKFLTTQSQGDEPDNQ